MKWRVVPRKLTACHQLVRSDLTGRRSALVKVVGPMQSGEECCRKSILTSVVVAVAFRREWL